MYLKKELYELIQSDESIFDFIQNGSLDGLWYWDLENPENEWMNARFWTVLGYNPDEMPHKSAAWQSIINQDDLKVANENFVKHCEDPNYPYDQVVRYAHKDGSTVWMRCRGLAIRDSDGKPIRMLGAHQDISDIKRREQELYEAKEKAEESEAKLNALFTSMSEMVVLHELVFDENGKPVNYRIIDCNDAFTKITGIRRNASVGRLSTEVYGTKEPPFLKEYSEVALTGEPQHYETYFQPMDKYFSISVVCPQKNHFATVTTDITESKQAERLIQEKSEEIAAQNEEMAVQNEELNQANRELIEAKQKTEESEINLQFKNEEYEAINEELLQTNDELIAAKERAEESEEKTRYILKHNPNAVAVFDNQMNLLMVSDRFLKDYDVTNKNIIGKNHYEVFPEIPEKWKNVHQKALQGEILSNDDDYFIRPDGSITYTRWECRPWYHSDNRIGGMISYTEVITERKQAEQALLAKIDELERFHKLTVGREINMIELKKEVNNLLNKLGQDNKYKIV